MFYLNEEIIYSSNRCFRRLVEKQPFPTTIIIASVKYSHSRIDMNVSYYGSFLTSLFELFEFFIILIPVLAIWEIPLMRALDCRVHNMRISFDLK